MSVDEKRKTAKAILAEAEPIHVGATQQVLKILTPEQAAKFDEQAMRTFGPRAIEAESVASRLKLSEEQKAAFAKLAADFDDATAPFIVVRKEWDLDEQYDTQMKKLDAAIKAMLTDEQRRTLDKAK